MGKIISIERQLAEIKRGAVDLVSEAELIAKLKRGKPLRIKAGFDPTAPDLHLGHTVLMQKLRQFQDLGHKVIFLIGDFTARIGDPSGRNETRPMLSEAIIVENAKTYIAQASKIIDMKRAEVRYNSEWLAKMSVIEFAALGAKQTVARMLERNDFKTRMREGHDVTLLEFYYPLMQAQDSVALHADVEIGGVDQIFNLLMGRTIQKRSGQESQVVLTMPLLIGTDGVQKMSKSFGNHIGINELPRDMFGKIMSISDEVMWRYYELLSSRTIDEIRQRTAAVADGKLHPKKAKEELALELVERFHSRRVAQAARDEFERVFSQGHAPTDLEVISVKRNTLLIDVAACSASVVMKSKSEFRRLVSQGGVRLDDEKITNPELIIPSGEHTLKIGKRGFLRIVVK